MKRIILLCILLSTVGWNLMYASELDGIWISQQDGSQIYFSQNRGSIFLLGFDLSVGLFQKHDIKYSNIRYESATDTYFGENRCNDASGAVHSWRPVSFKILKNGQMQVTDLQSGTSVLLTASPFKEDLKSAYLYLNGSWKRMDDGSIYYFYENKGILSKVGAALQKGSFYKDQVKLRNIIALSENSFLAENRQHNASGALVGWERVNILVEDELMTISCQKTGSRLSLLRMDAPPQRKKPLETVPPPSEEAPKTPAAPAPEPTKPLVRNPELFSALPKSITSNPHAIAVVIGNRDYKLDVVSSVEYALNDADAMKHYLINILGYQESNIIYKQNATLIDFYDIFGRENNPKGKLCNWVGSEREAPDVFVYYSGHGAPEIASGDAYLVPVDCSNIDRINLNGYSINLLYENLKQINYKSLTVILDSCFSGNSETGMLFKNISPVFTKSTVTAPVIRNATIITSASENQVAHWYPEKNHSVFTYYLLLGLKGKADLNEDNMISSKELESYVSQKVYSHVLRNRDRNQSPSFKMEDDKILVSFE